MPDKFKINIIEVTCRWSFNVSDLVMKTRYRVLFKVRFLLTLILSERLTLQVQVCEIKISFARIMML